MIELSRIDTIEKFKQVYDAATLEILDRVGTALENELEEMETARAVSEENKNDGFLSALLNIEVVRQHTRVDEIQKQLASLRACREYTVQQVAQEPIFIIGIPEAAKYMLSSLLTEIPNYHQESNLRYIESFDTDKLFTMVEFLES